ncbi:unnamed protein product [Eruca vesicaria subsp. sativa]|uniref:Cyclin-dependent kinase inhibitor n=1 Tax=Eruca vesicaria subsp. sativa TaxID=29727 RepID=A0ABC8LTD1_ERUVS|nr:unnamed protein product [Eruca vesicaria subsp. sativa]
MSERYPNCKRELETSSESISPFKKKKLDDYSLAADSLPSPSVASSDDSSRGGCSVTLAGEDDEKSSIIISGCFSTESNEIARESLTVALDLEAREISETETSTTFVTRNLREEVNPGSETTEMESSSATERDDRKTSPEVSKSPTPEAIEEFLSELESKDQKRFIEKYNFDIVNDKPLQGRYKWDRFMP